MDFRSKLQTLKWKKNIAHPRRRWFFSYTSFSVDAPFSTGMFDSPYVSRNTSTFIQHRNSRNKKSKLKKYYESMVLTHLRVKSNAIIDINYLVCYGYVRFCIIDSDTDLIRIRINDISDVVATYYAIPCSFDQLNDQLEITRQEIGVKPHWLKFYFQHLLFETICINKVSAESKANDHDESKVDHDKPNYNWNSFDDYGMSKSEQWLIDIFKDWDCYEKMYQFEKDIFQYTLKAIECDNIIILKTIFRKGKQYRSKHKFKPDQLLKMVQHATKYNAYDCTDYLLGHNNYTFNRRPIVLLNAIKAVNPDLVELVFQHMSWRPYFVDDHGMNRDPKTWYVLDDVFHELIKQDMLEFAQELVGMC